MKIIISKNEPTKVPVIALAIILLAGLFFNALPPSLQDVEAQVQNSNDSIPTDQLISQISTLVAKANPGINADNLKQLLTSMATQISQTLNEAESTKDVRQIYLQISTYPHGLVSQSLSQLVQLIANNTSNIPAITQQISLQKSSVKDVSQAIVNVAVQISYGGLSNIDQQISKTAQLIAKQTGVHPDKVESIIRQLSIQTAKVGGSDLASKTVQQIISQVNKNTNPNVALIQAIGMLAKSDDLGKTGKLLNFIKEIVKSSRDGEGTGSGGGSGGGGNKGDDGKKVVDRIIKIPALSQIIPAVRTPGAPGTTAIGGTETLPGIPNSVAFPPGSQLVDFDFLRGLVFVRLGLPGGPVVPFSSNADIRFGPDSKPIGVVCPTEFPCGKAIPQSASTGVPIPQSAPTTRPLPEFVPAPANTPKTTYVPGFGPLQDFDPTENPTTSTPAKIPVPRPLPEFICSPPITCDDPLSSTTDQAYEFAKKRGITTGINKIIGIPWLGGVLYPSSISPEPCSSDPKSSLPRCPKGPDINNPFEEIPRKCVPPPRDEYGGWYCIGEASATPAETDSTTEQVTDTTTPSPPINEPSSCEPAPQMCIPTQTSATDPALTKPEPPTDTTTPPATEPSSCEPAPQMCIPTQEASTGTTTSPAPPAPVSPANAPAPSGDVGGLGAGITAGETTTPPGPDSIITEPTEPNGQTIPPLDATTSSLQAASSTTPSDTKGEVVEPTKPTISVSDKTSSLATDPTTPSEAQGEVVAVEEPTMPTVATIIDPDNEAATDPTTSDESDMDTTETRSEGSGEVEEVTVEEEICDNGEDDDLDGDVDEEDSDCVDVDNDNENENENENELDPVDDPNVDVDEYLAGIDDGEEEEEEEEEDYSEDSYEDDSEDEEEDYSYDEGY